MLSHRFCQSHRAVRPIMMGMTSLSSHLAGCDSPMDLWCGSSCFVPGYCFSSSPPTSDFSPNHLRRLPSSIRGSSPWLCHCPPSTGSGPPPICFQCCSNGSILVCLLGSRNNHVILLPSMARVPTGLLLGGRTTLDGAGLSLTTLI